MSLGCIFSPALLQAIFCCRLYVGLFFVVYFVFFVVCIECSYIHSFLSSFQGDTQLSQTSLHLATSSLHSDPLIDEPPN